ncbi:hypothetical protein NKJ26_20145 [Mesorhizobium sp. M0152]|uniref:hypothetical protein n=1 Tax=Mesorhizobium sp. M0152 TaxID=2956898 RepID=UPI003338CB28
MQDVWIAFAPTLFQNSFSVLQDIRIGWLQAFPVFQKWEAKLAHTETRGSHIQWRGSFRTSFQESTALAISASRMWRHTAARRREIAGLRIDQLGDIGHPLADAPTPVLDVKAGLIANLMSMS